jgi:hypothetical protein
LSLDFWQVLKEFTLEASLRMNIWPIIKAPVAVQLNRTAFGIYVVVFGSVLWHFHGIASVEGTAIFLCMFLASVFGVISSCIRAPRSRWIISLLVLLIPTIVFVGVSLTEFSAPEGWLDWLATGFCVFAIWFSIPIMLALSLFISIGSIAFDQKHSLVVDVRSSGSCEEYFRSSNHPHRAELSSMAPPNT